MLHHRRFSVSKPSIRRFGIPAIGIVVLAALATVLVITTSFANTHPQRHIATIPSTLVKPAAVRHSDPRRPGTSPNEERVRSRYAALPVAFEENQGQADAQVQYVARGNGYKLLLARSKAIIALPSRKGSSQVLDMMANKHRGAAATKALLKKRALQRAKLEHTAILQMNFLGANPSTRLAANERQTGKVNYFIGNDPSQWHSDVPLFGRVNYQNIYPGIDLAFHGASSQLEFDYLVSPGADPASIALAFDGADSLQIDDHGDLLLTTDNRTVELRKPVAYQSRNGQREPVEARFVVKGKNEVEFSLGAYDRRRELVIDPTFVYSTYFGGNGADYGVSVAVDGLGDAFIAGATDSISIPASSGQGGTISPSGGGFDTFVTEIDPNGVCLFTTLFGGTGDDFPGGIALDGTSIYIAGTTSSSNFPATVGQTVFQGGTTFGDNDAYAVKLALNGSFTWGTYIAGSDSDSGLGIAVDSSQNVYVVGETFSTNLPLASALPSGTALNLGTGPGVDDGYIAKLNSGGTAYLLLSYIGGSDGDLATGVGLDAAGNIYVSGETISVDLPTNLTIGVLQSTCGTDLFCNGTTGGPFDDGFVVSIKANLSGYNYVTYYGGSNSDEAFAIAVDAGGNAFFTGRSSSTDLLITSDAYQNSLLGTTNAIVVELNPSGTTLNYGTYFGGDATDAGYGITLDTLGNVYITGQTTSSPASFPLLNPTQDTGDGSSDAFVSAIGISQGQLLFSTLLGGGGDEDQFQGGIALDPLGYIYVTGDTDSGNGSTAAFPTASPLDSAYGGGTCSNGTTNVPCTDAFIAEYSPANQQDFTLTAGAPAAVNPGSSATTTITVVPLSGYAGSVTLTCAESGSGSPPPACGSFSTNPVSATGTSDLTITTTGASAALQGSRNIFYAMWLPVVGLSLVGVGFGTCGKRRKKLLGFALLGVVMALLFFLPACGGSSNSGGGGGGGGCTGCTPAGTYTVTITGTDTTNNLVHSTAVAVTVN
jgi:hypothetical protein